MTPKVKIFENNWFFGPKRQYNIGFQSTITCKKQMWQIYRKSLLDILLAVIFFDLQFWFRTLQLMCISCTLIIYKLCNFCFSLLWIIITLDSMRTIFMYPPSYYVSLCPVVLIYVPLSRLVPRQHRHFFRFARILTGVWWKLGWIISVSNRWTDCILSEIVRGTREQDMRENSNRCHTGAAV